MADLNLVQLITRPEVIFTASGVFGMICHYVKKWARSETSSSMVHYFTKDNVNATMMTLGAFATAVIGALGSGAITPDMNTFGIIYSGMTLGFAVDSGFNKGAPPEPKE